MGKNWWRLNMDHNCMSGIVWQSEQEPVELIKSSTKFLSFLVIHNFSLYFFYLNHRMLKKTTYWKHAQFFEKYIYSICKRSSNTKNLLVWGLTRCEKVCTICGLRTLSAQNTVCDWDQFSDIHLHRLIKIHRDRLNVLETYTVLFGSR